MKIYRGFWKIEAKYTQKLLFWPKMAILAKNGHDHFWQFWGSKNFSTEKFFGDHLSHIEIQLHAKNPKKISNGQGCRTGTD